MIALLLLALITLIAFGLGARLLRPLRLRWSGLLEEFVFAAPVGLGAIAYLMLGIGLAGWLYRPVGLALLALAAAVGWRDIVRALRGVRDGLRRTRLPRDAAGVGIALFLTLIAAVALLGALAPASGRDWDGLTYHLAVPKIYLQAHRIHYLGWISHSNFPFSFEMLYLLGLLLWDQVLAKLFHFLAGVLLVLAVVSLARNFATTSRGLASRGGPVAAALLLSAPIITWEAAVAYNELAFALYVLLAVYAFLRSNQGSTRVPANRTGWLALAGILAGLALGTKTLAIVAPAFLAGALLLNRQQTVFRRLRETALVIGICIIIASPWYVKSWIWTGNPTYPFFYSTFGGRYWSAAAAQSYREAQLAYGVGATHVDYLAAPWREIHRVGPGAWLREGPFEFLVLPWNLTLHTASFADPPGLLSPLNVHLISLGPLFLALLPLAFLAGGLGPRHRFWLWFSLVFLIFWFAAAQIIRYMIPVLPALALGLAGALLALRERHPWLGRLIAIPVALGLIGSAATAYAFNADSFRVTLGRESRADYLRRTLGPYAIMEYANTSLPADAKLLLLEEWRGFYLDRPYMWGGGQNQMIAGRDYTSADTLLRALARYRINYVLMAPSFRSSLATGRAPLESAFRQALNQGYLVPVVLDAEGRIICRVETP